MLVYILYVVDFSKSSATKTKRNHTVTKSREKKNSNCHNRATPPFLITTMMEVVAALSPSLLDDDSGAGRSSSKEEKKSKWDAENAGRRLFRTRRKQVASQHIMKK